MKHYIIRLLINSVSIRIIYTHHNTQAMQCKYKILKKKKKKTRLKKTRMRMLLTNTKPTHYATVCGAYR